MTRTVQISGQRFELESGKVARALSKTLPEPVRDHYVVVGGRRFPPKQVIALVTGLDRADFTTHQARRILRGLGFPAARRSQLPGPAAVESPNGAKPSRAERLRPHIGEWVAVKDDDVLVGASTPGEVIAWLAQHDRQADSLFRVPEDEAGAGGMAPA